MRSNIRVWTWIAAALFCSGCASRELPVATAASAHKIGVISGFGNDISFSRSGITVFGNAASIGAIPEWKVDELIVNRVRADLSAGHEVAAFVANPKGDRQWIKRNFASVPEVVPPSNEHADLWLVVSGKCASAGDYSGPVPCGVAVSRPETMFGSPTAWIVLQGQIEVFDGATLKRIAESDILLDGQCGPFANGDLFDLARHGCEPGIDLGHSFAVDSWQDYTESQREFIHQQFLQFLEPSMDFTLRRLKLVK